MAVIRRVRTTEGEDQYGDPIPGTTTETTIDGAFVAPLTTEELVELGRAGLVVDLNLYVLDADYDLTPNDVVKVDGTSYAVQGEPARWKHPFTGWEPGLVVGLRRTQG